MILIPSGLIYDDLERQQELYYRSKVAALTARLETLPPGASRSEWQNALQREEPLLTRLGLYDRRVFDDVQEVSDSSEPQPFRAVVPYQDGRGTVFAEFQLARGQPEMLVEAARAASLVSAAGGVLVFVLGLFGAWGAGRLKTVGRAEAELEHNARIETISAVLAKEFEAAAGALNALPEPESTELVPYPKARAERVAAELSLLSSTPTPAIAAVDSAALVGWVRQRAENVKLVAGSEALRFASDPNLLGEAVLRLVRNAAEAKPEGEVRIDFISPKPNAVTIRVSDSAAKGAVGAGLTLPVARKLVSALGGTVSIEEGAPAEIRLENISVSPV